MVSQGSLCNSDEDDTSNQHLKEINLAVRMEYTGHVRVGAKKSLRGQALFAICIFLVKSARIFKVGETEEEVLRV